MGVFDFITHPPFSQDISDEFGLGGQGFDALNLFGTAGVGAGAGQGGKKGGSGVAAPDVGEIAATDFLFNRVDQFGPGGDTQFFAPGQEFDQPQTPQFAQGGLTPGARGLLPPQARASKGGTPTPPLVGPVPDVPTAVRSGPVNTRRAGRGADPDRARNRSNPANVVNAPVIGAGGANANPFAELGDIGNVTQVQTLTPEQLALAGGAQTTTLNTIADVLGRQGEDLPDIISALTGVRNPLDTSQLQTALPGEFTDVLEQQSSAFFDRGSELLDRNFDQNLDILEQRLANRGFNLDDSTGSSVQFGEFADSRRDALNALTNDALIFGGQEASRAIADTLSVRGQEVGEQATGFGQDLQIALNNALLGNQARGTEFNERQALLGGSQVNLPGAPGTGPGQSIVDAFGLNLAGQNQQAAIDQANKGSAIGGASAIGSALIGLFSASSRTFKDVHGDETNILERLEHVPIKRWNYKSTDQEHIGPMAEDWNAAFNLPDVPYISYLDVMGIALGAIRELKAELEELKNGRIA